jgi:hypothetical protein
MKFCPQGRHPAQGPQKCGEALPGGTREGVPVFRRDQTLWPTDFPPLWWHGRFPHAHHSSFPDEKNRVPPDSQTEVFRVLFIFEYFPVLGTVPTKQEIVKDRSRGIKS